MTNVTFTSAYAADLNGMIAFAVTEIEFVRMFKSALDLFHVKYAENDLLQCTEALSVATNILDALKRVDVGVYESWVSSHDFQVCLVALQGKTNPKSVPDQSNDAWDCLDFA